MNQNIFKIILSLLFTTTIHFMHASEHKIAACVVKAYNYTSIHPHSKIQPKLSDYATTQAIFSAQERIAQELTIKDLITKKLIDDNSQHHDYTTAPDDLAQAWNKVTTPQHNNCCTIS